MTDFGITPEELGHREWKQADVLAAVEGLTAGKLQMWLSRGLLKLEQDQSPGTGQRRLWTGFEVIKVAALHYYTENYELPVSVVSHWIAPLVEGRAHEFVAAPKKLQAAKKRPAKHSVRLVALSKGHWIEDIFGEHSGFAGRIEVFPDVLILTVVDNLAGRRMSRNE